MTVNNQTRALVRFCCALSLALPVAASAALFQAESYTAFFDKTKGNTGNVFRSDDVDIEACKDSGGGYNVGWIDATEWLVYSDLVIPASGDYMINARVASTAGAQIAVDLNGGTIKLGNITVPNTGGWQNWATASSRVHIDAGTYRLGVYAVTGGWNFNWIEVVPVAVASSSVPSSVPTSSSSSSVSSQMPGTTVTVQAEDFTAYSDLTTGNTGGAYRPNDNVDIEATTDNGGGFNVGWTQAGEWLEYKVALAAGNYNVNARVASASTTGKLTVLVDGVAIGSASVGNTGGWQAWKTQLIGAPSFNAGMTHTVRVLIDGADVNINWLQFEPVNNQGCSVSPLCVDKSKGEWTLVVIPDTQHYSQNRANAPIANMQKGFDWIVSAKDDLNIKFVQGLGDITENFNAPTDWEWANSFSAWNRLSGKLAYIPVKGNHDLNQMINKYFPVSMFSRESWWAGNMGNGIENNYGYMTIGREDYLFLQVTNYDNHRPDAMDGLNWAKGILAANPNKKVILATHDIWSTTVIKDNLLTKFDNIVLANAGHDCVRQTSYVTTGPRGGVSNNFVSDFQCDPQEVMFMRYYVFKPLEDKVYFYTYSPVINQFLTTNESQGSFTLVQKD